MNLRKTFLAGALTLGLLGSIAAPTVTATPIGIGGADTIDVNVTVPTSGVFAGWLCEVASEITDENLHVALAPEAHTAGLATGQLRICYVDTVNYRGSFDAQLEATNFTANNSPIQTPINASNFTIAYTYNVQQAHWTNDGSYHNPATGPHVPALADIGYYVNNADPNGQNVAGAAWTTNNALDDAKTVHFSWNGPGTQLSYGDIDVELVLPAGTAPGDYESDLTLTLIASSRAR